MLVVIGILVIQTFLALLILMLCGNPDSRIGSIASVLTISSGIMLGLFLSKVFELFTGANFGEMYYNLYNFNKPKSLDHLDLVKMSHSNKG